MKKEGLIKLLDGDYKIRKEITDVENKKIYFVEYIINMITYDDELAEYYYDNYFKPTLTSILNKGEMGFSSNKDEYVRYNITCNLILGLRGLNSLDWGTSIRDCWFDSMCVPLYYPSLGFKNYYLNEEDMKVVLEWVENDN